MNEARGTSDLLAGAGGSAAGGGTLFQQQVGAWVCSWMLAELPVDPVFGLGNDSPSWLRLETEAPVDDVLIATERGGFIAMQLKRTLSASSNVTSEFGKTIDQFVRQWIVCSTGQRQMGWDRPLNPALDRLVLVVGPEASSTIKHDLVSALRHRRGPGHALLTQEQSEVLSKFESCAAAAWSALSSDPQPGALLTDLYALVSVITFSPDDQRATSNLQSGGVPHADAAAIANLLISQCGNYIAQRSGADTATLRRELLGLGARLPSQPSFRGDILKLQEHTARVAQSLGSYEVINAGSGPVSVPRECQAIVNEASRQGPLLIVGDPGVGKSAVLNTLATSLRSEGRDVIELAVDGYSIETLEGLQQVLRLDHPLTEVIEAWDGQDRAWLIIDALDAARGGKTEAVFRGLLAQVQQMNGRWIVVASIRSFDLQMGMQYRTLFAGRPPSSALADARFNNVRHVAVPSWTSGEFERVLEDVTALRRVIDAGGAKLREVAMVPFNARLLCELIEGSSDTFDSKSVGTRLELLRAYWSQRVESLGIAGEACLAGLVGRMVSRQSLRASKLELSAHENPAAIEALLREGVIRAVDNGRQLEFSHHLLFDYATSRVYIDLTRVVQDPELLAKDNAPGLMLAPGMVFALQDLWIDSGARCHWWSAAIVLISDDRVDPIIRSVVSRVAADLPSRYDDFDPLIADLAIQGERPARALSNLVGAFVVRLEDDSDAVFEPWARLAKGIARWVDIVEWPLRILCHQLVSRLTAPHLRSDVGEASRELLRYGLTLEDPRNTVVAAVSFVADTYMTDLTASRALLESVLEEDRFERFASEEIPALARKIETIVDADPTFAINIYKHAYARNVQSDHPTSLGASRIMPLRSTAKQDFELARYCLSQYFPAFLAKEPLLAVDALLVAYQGFVNREHTPSNEQPHVDIDVNGRTYYLQTDFSHIWASDPEGKYATDADALLAHLWKAWREVQEDVALLIASSLTSKGYLAVYWSRLFMVTMLRRGAMAERYWAFATREQFLLCMDTFRPAIRFIAAVYESRTKAERTEFELSTQQFDYSGFNDPAAARAKIESIIFGSIEKAHLATDHARDLWHDIAAQGKLEEEWVSRFERETYSTYHWIEGLDRAVPANAALISAIDEANSLIDQRVAESAADQALVTHGQATLCKLVLAIEDQDVHPELAGVGLDALGDITEKILHRCLRAAPDFPAIPDSYLHFVELAATSSKPTVTEDTEREFEESASWGSPAGRISAAESAFMMVPLRPDLYDELRPLQERLIVDPHPAVRLQSANRLVHIWDADRERFWLQVRRTLADEQNASVVDSLLANQLQRFQVIARDKLQELLTDFISSVPERKPAFAKVGARAAQILFLMWLTEPNAALNKLVDAWVSDRSANTEFLGSLLHLCRESLTAGLLDRDSAGATLRKRSIKFVHDAVIGANRVLEEYYSTEVRSDELTTRSQACSKLVDDACMQIYFAADGLSKAQLADAEHSAGTAFTAEIKPTLEAISAFAETHTVYYLMQILEGQVTTDPQGMFDLLSNLMLSAGKRSGFQYESLGADLFVRLVGIYLADHKEIFDNQDRRQALVACLDVFISAGWPSARRLLYHLADLVQ